MHYKIKLITNEVYNISARSVDEALRLCRDKLGEPLSCYETNSKDTTDLSALKCINRASVPVCNHKPGSSHKKHLRK